MSYSATVFNVMIASPGDVSEERDIASEAIYKWNAANAVARKTLLSPLKWETHSTPTLGLSAQAIINQQVLEHADILVGIFGSRLGTPTENFLSGTVEEIKRHHEAGKVAKVYFSNAPIERADLNFDQLRALAEFQEECRTLGLYATYSNQEQFRESFSHHLSLEMNRDKYVFLASSSPRIEALERAMAEIQLKMRDREVTAEQVSSLQSASEGRAKGLVLVRHTHGDGEVIRYTDSVMRALRDARWTATLTEGRVVGNLDLGVKLSVACQSPEVQKGLGEKIDELTANSSVYYAKALKDACASAGIVINDFSFFAGPTVLRDSVLLSIGQKAL